MDDFDYDVTKCVNIKCFNFILSQRKDSTNRKKK